MQSILSNDQKRSNHNCPNDFLPINQPEDIEIELELQKLERIVHIDLKGALPKVAYFKELFKMLKEFGATGILIEYEDVFPFTGRLKEAVSGNAYSLSDIEYIKKQAVTNGLYIIPLIQTYGHLEWILKVCI